MSDNPIKLSVVLHYANYKIPSHEEVRSFLEMIETKCRLCDAKASREKNQKDIDLEREVKLLMKPSKRVGNIGGGPFYR